MAITDKLQSILDSKAAIKSAIEAKGVSDVGDVLANYADKIASIETGGSTLTKWTGHADEEGLRAIGWDDDDIAYYQKNGVNWNEEDDEFHKVPEDNKALYGVVNITTVKDYASVLVYCPKFDTSAVTNMSNMFQNCYSLVAVPKFNTSAVTNMRQMFQKCCALTSVPLFDTSAVTNMFYMFYGCYALTSVPLFDTSAVTNMSNMFQNCYSLVAVPKFNTSAVTNMYYILHSCRVLSVIPLLDMSKVTVTTNLFLYASSIRAANLKNLVASVDISATSLLTKNSVLYMIENEAATSPITITLSTYCYNKYNTDEEVTAALANHPNVSLASA